MESFEDLSSFMSMHKSVLKINGGNLKNHYDSEKWDSHWKNRSEQRCWKSYRRSQYKRILIIDMKYSL